MKNKKIISLVGIALATGMIATPTLVNNNSKVENIRLLSDTTINNTVNNNGNGNSTNINNTVNNGGTSSNNGSTPAADNQTVTPASSKSGYKAGQVIVTLGANLTSAEKSEMLSDFGVTQGQSGVKFVTTTNKDIAIELGLNPNNIIPGSTSISSTKVTLLPSGSGISVSTNNLTEVTGDMLASALVTCGISDASIVANAPYPVTGQAALAGILQGFQDVTGTVIPERNKQVANQEVNVTTSLGNQIGQAKAEQVVTQAKKQVVDQKPTNTTEITNIVNNVTNNNGVTLTAAQQQQLVNLMTEIKNLNLSSSKVNSTLNQIESSINNGKKDFSNVSASVSNEFNKLKKEGFFSRIGHDIEDFFHDIGTFFEGGSKAVENQNATNQQATTSNGANTGNSTTTTTNQGGTNGNTVTTTTTSSNLQSSNGQNTTTEQNSN